MTANVEKMALIGEPSWHGLEHVMPLNSSLDEWYQHSGLKFNVVKSPVRYRLGDGVEMTSDDHCVLYRDDTYQDLSVVGSKYKVVQPKKILYFFEDFIKSHQCVMETAGSLDGGRKVWALARTGDAFYATKNDEVREYLLLATSYDTSMRTICKHTAIRVVCQNTLGASLREKGKAITVSHRSEFDETEIKLDMGLLLKEWNQFKYNVIDMARIQIDIKYASSWYATFLGIEKQDDIDCSRMHAQLMDCFSNGKGASSSLWGVLNGVTAWVDHVRGRNPDNRVNSAWFGTGAALKDKAMKQAMESISG